MITPKRIRNEERTENAATEREGDVEIKSGESTILENQTERDEERKETTADQRRKIEQTKKGILTRKGHRKDTFYKDGATFKYDENVIYNKVATSRGISSIWVE